MSEFVEVGVVDDVIRYPLLSIMQPPNQLSYFSL